MVTQTESPAPPVGKLTTGHFRMKRHYARWREQGTPGWLLVYTLGGRGRFGHGNGELVVSPGDLVLLRPKARNDYGLEAKLRRWDFLWAYFFPRSEWHDLLQWPEAGPGVLCIHVSEPSRRRVLSQQMAEIHRLNSGPLVHHEMFAMNALEKCLLHCDLINPRSRQSDIDPRVLRALDYLCESLSEPVVLPDLARHCGISLSRLAHLFRAQVGQTPQQFLELKRMARACRLLELTQNPVAQIASILAFHDPFHFSNRFKRHLGLSPRAYRQQVAAGKQRPWRYVRPKN